MEPAVGTNRKKRLLLLNLTAPSADKTKSGSLARGRKAMVSMVIIMFLIGVLILLFAGRLAEVLMARAELRGPGKAPATAARRLHEHHGRLAVEKGRT
jgi:hypothetical protein